VIKAGNEIKFTSGVKGKCAETSTRPTTVDYTTPANLPCGTFVKYNPNGDPKSVQSNPDAFGLYAGVNYDDTPQYVGYGYCPDFPPFPVSGFISTNTSRPGACLLCNTFYDIAYLYSDTEDSYFLLKHPNLKWAQTNANEFSTLRNAVKIGDDGLFGRVFYHGRYRLGRVPSITPASGIIDENDVGKFFDEDFQILTCSTCNNGGSGKFCCPNGEFRAGEEAN